MVPIASARASLDRDLGGLGGAETGVQAERLLPVTAGVVLVAEGRVGAGRPWWARACWSWSPVSPARPLGLPVSRQSAAARRK